MAGFLLCTSLTARDGTTVGFLLCTYRTARDGTMVGFLLCISLTAREGTLTARDIGHFLCVFLSIFILFFENCLIHQPIYQLGCCGGWYCDPNSSCILDSSPQSAVCLADISPNV